MIDYLEICKKCEEDSKLSIQVLDLFIINYHLDMPIHKSKLHLELKTYRKQLIELGVQNISLLIAEYGAHQLFKENGYIHAYLKDPKILKLSDSEYKYLEWHSRHPWRFSFAIIIGNPAPKFFKMQDLLTGETYLLFSPGIQETCEEYIPRLCFNLISYNGHCWQTFGMVLCAKGYTIDDIFFLAELIDSSVDGEEDIFRLVESNCFPFLLLVLGMHFPQVIARGFETFYCGASDYQEMINQEQLRKHFKITQKGSIIQLESLEMGSFPHHAIAYFDRKKNELIRNASSLEGFEYLTEKLIESGVRIDSGADYYVTPAMYAAAEKILSRKISISSDHARLFSEPEPKQHDLTKRMNKFLELILPGINSGQKPDIEELALAAGIDIETAERLWEELSSKYSR